MILLTKFGNSKKNKGGVFISLGGHKNANENMEKKYTRTNYLFYIHPGTLYLNSNFNLQKGLKTPIKLLHL